LGRLQIADDGQQTFVRAGAILLDLADLPFYFSERFGNRLHEIFDRCSALIKVGSGPGLQMREAFCCEL
jgi:hypothetical protein